MTGLVDLHGLATLIDHADAQLAHVADATSNAYDDALGADGDAYEDITTSSLEAAKRHISEARSDLARALNEVAIAQGFRDLRGSGAVSP